MSGLIRDHPQTSQQHKIQILKKSYIILILKGNFGFRLLWTVNDLRTHGLLHRRSVRGAMRQGLRLLLARFLTNCFANEALKSGMLAHVLI
ncbi:hypothetical protein AGR13a_Lc100164 [Agrobacterium genomosp. 13 str. CFBP 6927]|uniref:Transposase n=1 Tax=Agrobacterium genomosp. 13 str. CFBP 6927 TaxID=1183428 RepID=A0ABM9VIY8_9HYPH|nr:hypothetical protein AGR13a_Lc100164 [Agrobacterium genomosp. 13 str. CFBP 6927]